MLPTTPPPPAHWGCALPRLRSFHPRKGFSPLLEGWHFSPAHPLLLRGPPALIRVTCWHHNYWGGGGGIVGSGSGERARTAPEKLCVFSLGECEQKAYRKMSFVCHCFQLPYSKTLVTFFKVTFPDTPAGDDSQFPSKGSILCSPSSVYNSYLH